MQDNEAAYRAYLKAGYVYLGIIRNPIGKGNSFNGDIAACFKPQSCHCKDEEWLKVYTVVLLMLLLYRRIYGYRGGGVTIARWAPVAMHRPRFQPV